MRAGKLPQRGWRTIVRRTEKHWSKVIASRSGHEALMPLAGTRGTCIKRTAAIPSNRAKDGIFTCLLSRLVTKNIFSWGAWHSFLISFHLVCVLVLFFTVLSLCVDIQHSQVSVLILILHPREIRTKALWSQVRAALECSKEGND